MSQIRDPATRLKIIGESATRHGFSCFNPKDSTVIRYIRSAPAMIKSANEKRDSGSLEEAYFIYVKFSSLYLEKVRKHPAYAAVAANDQKTLSKFILAALEEAEKLKPLLLRQFQDEDDRLKELEAAAEASRVEQYNREQLAKEQVAAHHRQHHDDAVLAQQLEQEERYGFYRGRAEAQHRVQQQLPTSSNYSNVPNQVVNIPPPAVHVGTMNHSATDSTSPERPAAPSVDRASKPRMIPMSVRKLVLPSNLATTFLRLSLNNTIKNTETCGILGACANSSQNEYVVTHLLLPPQHGTPDSCTTQDEEKLFQKIDDLNLLVVGWIHTHPSQNAFLSSVDLHTHAGYQHLLPESIAIVCSVKFDDTRVFRITGAGLDVLAMCDKTGFHEHPGTTNGDPLFADVDPDDLKWDSSLHIQVVDLRD